MNIFSVVLFFLLGVGWCVHKREWESRKEKKRSKKEEWKNETKKERKEREMEDGKMTRIKQDDKKIDDMDWVKTQQFDILYCQRACLRLHKKKQL